MVYKKEKSKMQKISYKLAVGIPQTGKSKDIGADIKSYHELRHAEDTCEVLKKYDGSLKDKVLCALSQ